ncbi:MAG: FAD-binding protein [Crocinitomicaceae bacterium]|jgi:glycolate oxidase|nr:FAD-binding protein [Crocinitomicaceae bacterium]MBT5401994.1 FAD-binding protein [Crocinitomicaceae bacterium]MBT6515420.1 FAD-binding protein [Crocinitomicaceae bacterium]
MNLQNEYQRLNQINIQWFIALVGPAHCAWDEETRIHYGHDETEDLSFPPEIVVKPTSTLEVSQIMSYCFEHSIPVTPLGARTGLSGGALSIHGGVGLSLEKMNNIISIDQNNLQVITQPGVITQVLQEEVAKMGLFYAPDPSSKGSCFIGGNIAENAGGPRAVKYGVTKDFVLNLEVVLPNGEVIWTGANTLKNATGYNLTQLMVGSEGTLGIVTQAVLKLLPLPTHNLLMLAPFSSAIKACEAVSAVFKAGITPSALEFMERDAIDWTMKYEEVNLIVADNVEAHLLIEVDGNNEDVLLQDCEKISEVLEGYECGEIMFADNEAQKDQLWKLRRRVGEAVKSNSIYKEEDTVVPRFELPKLLSAVKEIGQKYGFKSVCYGHAGDGNLHINIIKGDLPDSTWTNDLPKAITELFEFTVSLGGTLSGEHGIGYVQKGYMPIAFPEVHMALLRGVKELFDPKRIMNPGKILP